MHVSASHPWKGVGAAARTLTRIPPLVFANRCQGLDPIASSTAWVCWVTTTTMSQKILRKKQKRKSFEELNGPNNRFLISINVLGSAGPIRFVVNEGDLIAEVIDTALKSYARQGRLPRLGSDTDQFLLYCANFGADALSPWELIGSSGGRNFVLCKKQIEPEDRMRETRPRMLAQKGCGSWKLWLNKSFKILTI